MQQEQQNPGTRMDGGAPGADAARVRSAFSYRFIRDIDALRKKRQAITRMAEEESKADSAAIKASIREDISLVRQDCRKIEDKLSAELKWAEEMVKHYSAAIRETSDMEEVASHNQNRMLFQYKVNQIKEVL